MSDRRRFLLSTGVLAAGAAAFAAWPTRDGGAPAGPRARGGTESMTALAPQADGRRPLAPQAPQAEPQAAPQPGQGQTLAKRPNFVLILADDLGFGQLGCYGQKKIRTPRIDRMAREGLRFTDAYASAPVCAPSRASLLTGLHSGHSAVRRNPPKEGEIPLGANEPTIAEMLQANGYRTGLFGKWGFGPNAGNNNTNPNARGFTDFFGYMTHHMAKRYYPEFLWDNGQRYQLPGNSGDNGPIYGPGLIMQRALTFLRDADRQGQPFLLMLTLPLPHAPSVSAGLGQYRGKDWRRQDKAHAAQVSQLDGYVGVLLDELRRLGLADDTIVVFTSDNGPHEEDGVRPRFFDAAGPYRGLKRNLYEGGIRIPFIVWSPKLLRRTARKRTTHPTVQYDLMATFADFAGIKAPKNDGLSLRRVWTGTGKAPRHEYLYWLRLHAGSTKSHRAEERGKGRRCAAAVRFDEWKLIGFAPGTEYSTPGGKWTYELYNLNKDPGERHNLAKARPALVRRGERYLKRSWRPLD
ncbi:arylsulfatase [Actinocorallia populi]|uniref:arylsulfatase n=1 Tax=Actinocorallia populi TaxID=2079200 RepID=UPI000D08E585|nr:arylsulfatase [Actinocorallia populi]